MGVPWPSGTDSGDKLRKALQNHIRTWLANPKYKDRLPPKVHRHILLEGEREGPGLVVKIVSEGDPEPPHLYKKGNSDVTEDWHQVALIVKADAKNGGADSVSAMFGALRALFTNRSETPEGQALTGAGIYMCSETPEGLIMDPDGDTGEGTFSKQQINLRCNTDTYLN
jgi:hypothetical protein